MIRTRLTIAVALIAMTATLTWAQEPVRELQDLIGARGSAGESALQQRGYSFVRAEQGGNASYTYWRNAGNNACIIVRTEDGRYASIVSAPSSDCGGSAEPTGDETVEFETVCGVMVDGSPVRYVCTATVHHQGGQRSRTVLRFPDMTMSLNWHDHRDVTVNIEGMNPIRGTYSTSEGETTIVIPDRTYFFISNQDRAKMDVQDLRRRQR